MTKKINYKDEIKKHEFRVTIFGSSVVKPNSTEYKQAYKLAKELGKRSIDVVTGGGPGIMEAASKGHHAGRPNKKTQTIGLNIHLPHEQKPNNSLDVVYEFKRFSKRLDNFMSISSAFVFSNGGVGTLLEYFYTWQLIQTKKICDTPIILMGDMWPTLIRAFKKTLLQRGYYKKVDMKHIYLVKDHKEALEIIQETAMNYASGKNNCINIKKIPAINNRNRRKKQVSK
jgi:uncharacterized protein (TIGR00730 family)